jgi:hypothetical protein
MIPKAFAFFMGTKKQAYTRAVKSFLTSCEIDPLYRKEPGSEE